LNPLPYVPPFPGFSPLIGAAYGAMKADQAALANAAAIAQQLYISPRPIEASWGAHTASQALADAATAATNRKGLPANTLFQPSAQLREAMHLRPWDPYPFSPPSHADLLDALTNKQGLQDVRNARTSAPTFPFPSDSSQAPSAAGPSLAALLNPTDATVQLGLPGPNPRAPIDPEQFMALAASLDIGAPEIVTAVRLMSMAAGPQGFLIQEILREAAYYGAEKALEHLFHYWEEGKLPSLASYIPGGDKRLAELAAAR
jgi:hypothetical protein